MLVNGTALLNPIYEYSADGITWVEFIPVARQSSSYAAGQWYWQDVASPQSAQYYRVRETSGGTLNVTEMVFGTSANEIILSQINKDDYQNLPCKNQVGRPLQYWFDRQIVPQAWIWRASAYSFNSLVVWSWRVIQDIGAFSNTIQIPPWWYDPIMDALAARLIWVLPGADLSRAPMLEQKAMMSKNAAWIQSKDNSPVYLSPMIGGYTQQGGRR